MKKNRILVVDDEADITRELKAQLEHTGRFDVQAENTGSAALKAVRSFHPDMAILDVMMPDMDGGELKFRLQQIPELRTMPVAYLTAAIRHNEVNNKELFIEKPVEIERIISIIDQQLGVAGSAAAPAPA